jgi:hypothetical protein
VYEHSNNRHFQTSIFYQQNLFDSDCIKIGGEQGGEQRNENS